MEKETKKKRRERDEGDGERPKVGRVGWGWDSWLSFLDVSDNYFLVEST